MARLPLKVGPSKAAQVLVFANVLTTRLDTNPNNPSLISDLREAILSCSTLSPSSLQADTRLEFDHLGTQLWNISTRLGRNQASQSVGKLLSLLRAFAFLLLDLAHRSLIKSSPKQTDNGARVFRTALKAARTCLDQGENGVCSTVFQKAADYEGAINGSDWKNVDGKEYDPFDVVSRKLVSEYWLLRATHMWKTDRLDITHNFLQKIPVRYDESDHTDLAEKQADLNYEIGKALSVRQQFKDAIGWLEKSCEILEHVEGDRLSPDAAELRTTALHDLAKALLGIGDESSLVRAADLVAFLDAKCGPKMAISILKLDLLSVRKPIPPEEFHKVVVHMMSTVVLTESAFKIIMQKIQQLCSIGPYLACATLQQFLSVRLFESENKSWIQKAVVTVIWVAQAHVDVEDMNSTTSLRAIMDEVLGAIGNPFDADAAHASQTLMWKIIEALQRAGQNEHAESWCRLARHPLLEHGGDMNKSKLARKMMLSTLAKGDTATARESYYQMSEVGQKAISTNYLMYKVALRSEDNELASQSLKAVFDASSGDATHLFACLLEAQQSGNRRHAIDVLLKLVESGHHGPHRDVYLPAIFRCAAQLLMTEMSDNVTSLGKIMPELCKLYEAAAAQTDHFQRAPSAATQKNEYALELQWFAKTTYNLAVKECVQVEPNLTVRLLTCCIHFLHLAQTQYSEQKGDMLQRREATCHFLGASVLTVLARGSDKIDMTLQYYIEVRKHVAAFYTLYESMSIKESMDVRDSVAFTNKQTELLKFDLEAVVKLERWDDLDGILAKCLEQREVKHLKTLADLIIVIHTHVVEAKLDARFNRRIPGVMQKIINQSWKSGQQDIRNVSRWLRCVFRMTIDLNPDISLACLDQAISIATRFWSSGEGSPYPADELEWLASKAFNHAIDLYCESDEGACRQWGERALNLARASSPGSGFHASMQGLWMKLNLRHV